MVDKLTKYIKIIENILKLYILWPSTSTPDNLYWSSIYLCTKSQVHKAIYPSSVFVSLNYMK